MLRLLLLAQIGVAGSALAQVQEEPAEEDAGVPDEVVAAPTDESTVHSQVASFAVTKLKDSPAVVTVISAEDIKQMGSRDLIDVLYMVPGFFFGIDVQGIVGPGFRGMWGYEGKILLLIDGKEMNELLYSTLQLGNEFPVELIERVEVVRGPGSVIYGGNAELAVINVVTKGLQGGTELMVAGTYGQSTASDFGNGYMRRGVVAMGRYVFEDVPGLSAYVSGSLGQGQRSVRDYTSWAGDSATMLGQSRLDPATVQAGIGYRDFQLTFLLHHYATTGIDGTGDLNATPEAANFDSYHVDAQYTARPSSRVEILPRLNFIYQHPWTTPDQSSAFFYDKSVWRARARLVARWAPIDELQITVGGDALADHAYLNAPAFDGSGMPIGLQTQFGTSNVVNYQTYALFAEVFSENPIVNGAVGIRYEHNSLVGDSVVPRLVLLRSFGILNLKALGSLAFRAPGVENINAGVDATGAPGPVKPERTVVAELEASVDISKQQRVALNVFDVGINAPIVYSVNPMTGAEGYQNLGRQGSAGVEASYRIRGGWGHAEANYSFYAPVGSFNIDKYVVPGHSDAYAGAPAHRFMLIGTLKPWSWFGISPSLLILGPRYAFAAPDANNNFPDAYAVPTQVMANLFVRFELPMAKGLAIGVGAYNIFGTHYTFLQPYAGGHAPLPGLDREFLIKLSYTFEPTYSE